ARGSGGGGRARRARRAPRNLLRTIVHPREGVASLDLAPPGSKIETSTLPPDGSKNAGFVRLVDTATGAATDLSLPLPAEVPVIIYHMVFSPDGAYLAAAHPGIRIWRISDSAVWADIPGYGDDIAYSAAGELAVRRDVVVDVFAVPSGT